MPTRFTMLLQITTDPANRAAASPHTGGWSESFWHASDLASSDGKITVLTQRRAALLGRQGSIVGFRLQHASFAGPRIKPAGSSTGKLQLPGVASRDTDMPQAALEMGGTAVGKPNSSRFSLRGIPDDMITKGEYQPVDGYSALVDQFETALVGGGWSFLGRDLSKPTFRVMGIVGNVLTLDAPGIYTSANSWARLMRVVNDDGKLVSGSWKIQASSGNTVDLIGYDKGDVSKPSGQAREDAVVLCQFATVKPARTVARKIGRPFESYRGKQSKNRRA